MTIEHEIYLRTLTTDKLKVHQQWLADCAAYTKYHIDNNTYAIIPEDKKLITCDNGIIMLVSKKL